RCPLPLLAPPVSLQRTRDRPHIGLSGRGPPRHRTVRRELSIGLSRARSDRPCDPPRTSSRGVAGRDAKAAARNEQHRTVSDALLPSQGVAGAPAPSGRPSWKNINLMMTMLFFTFELLLLV